MADNRPYTWKPTEIIELTNISDDNFILDLDSGMLRLDIGRTLRVTGSALEHPQVMALINTGKLKAQPFRRK